MMKLWPFELLADDFRFLAALEVTGLELGALGIEMLLVGLRGAQSLAARQEEVACIAVADLHGFAHLAELCDALEKDHFHGCLL